MEISYNIHLPVEEVYARIKKLQKQTVSYQKKRGETAQTDN